MPNNLVVGKNMSDGPPIRGFWLTVAALHEDFADFVIRTDLRRVREQAAEIEAGDIVAEEASRVRVGCKSLPGDVRRKPVLARQRQRPFELLSAQVEDFPLQPHGETKSLVVLATGDVDSRLLAFRLGQSVLLE